MDYPTHIMDNITHFVPPKGYNDRGDHIHGSFEDYYKCEIPVEEGGGMTLQNIIKYGGVCGSIQEYAQGICNAFGIPCFTCHQPMHAAYIMLDKKGWHVGNDSSGRLC